MTKFEIWKFRTLRFLEDRFFRLWRLQCDVGLDDCWVANLAFRLYCVCDRRTNPEPVHGWFELTYAQYLTVPRSVLQSMPKSWQCRFVACLEELDNTFDWRPESGCYWVTLLDELDEDEDAPACNDPLRLYRDGRTYRLIKSLRR